MVGKQEGCEGAGKGVRSSPGVQLWVRSHLFHLNQLRGTFSLPPGQLVPGSRPPSQVYVDLIRSYNSPGEYSSCFTELQRDFVISRPTKLKSLIRLVKHWYRQVRPTDAPSLPPAPSRWPWALPLELFPGRTLRQWRFVLVAGP